MHAVDLIASAIPSDAAPAIEPTCRGICCVTGKETDCVPRGEVLERSFTAQALLCAPLSECIGVAAARALRYRPERSSSWWCDGACFVPLRRVDVRARVLSRAPAQRPWSAYATTSYKKHGALAAPVNTGYRAVWLWETLPIDCSDLELVHDWWRRLREMQDLGFPRPVLETLDPSPQLIAKASLAWFEFDSWARPRRSSPRYAFICYLLPSAEELKGWSNGEEAEACTEGEVEGEGSGKSGEDRRREGRCRG